jgi:leucyl-tRNA synthetase
VEPPLELLRRTHRTIGRVTEELDAMRFNTAIAALIELNNALWKEEIVAQSVAGTLTLLLSPFAPHLAEELWQALGHTNTLAYEPWPTARADLLVEQMMDIPVQVNGRVRATLQVPVSTPGLEVLTAAKAHGHVAQYLQGQNLVKEIYVPGKIVNLVVKPA